MFANLLIFFVIFHYFYSKSPFFVPILMKFSQNFAEIQHRSLNLPSPPSPPSITTIPVIPPTVPVVREIVGAPFIPSETATQLRSACGRSPWRAVGAALVRLGSHDQGPEVLVESAREGRITYAGSNSTIAHYLTLKGSFAGVWTATIARNDAFCSMFRDLQDLHSFAPLRTEKII